MIIQILLVIFAVSTIIFVLLNRNTYLGKAWKKVGLILLFLVMILVVLFPEITSSIAHALGVGRGTDLLLYTVVVAFIIYALNNYLNQQDQRDTIYQLARKIALMEAHDRYNAKKKKYIAKTAVKK